MSPLPERKETPDSYRPIIVPKAVKMISPSKHDEGNEQELIDPIKPMKEMKHLIKSTAQWTYEAIYSSDYERSLKWYQSAFGFQTTNLNNDFGCVEYAPGRIIQLGYKSIFDGPRKIGFISKNLKAIKRQLIRANIAIESEDDSFLTVKDPDGNLIEIRSQGYGTEHLQTSVPSKYFNLFRYILETREEMKLLAQKIRDDSSEFDQVAQQLTTVCRELELRSTGEPFIVSEYTVESNDVENVYASIAIAGEADKPLPDTMEYLTIPAQNYICYQLNYLLSHRLRTPQFFQNRSKFWGTDFSSLEGSYYALEQQRPDYIYFSIPYRWIGRDHHFAVQSNFDAVSQQGRQYLEYSYSNLYSLDIKASAKWFFDMFGFQILDITPEKAVLEVAPGRILYLSSDEKETARQFIIFYEDVEPIRQRLQDKNVHLEEVLPWWLKFRDPDQNMIGIWTTSKQKNLVEMAPEVIYGTIRFHLESREQSRFVIRTMDDRSEFQSASEALMSDCKAIGIVPQGGAILISRFSKQVDSFFAAVPVASALNQLPDGSEYVDIPAQDYAVYPIHKTILEGEQRKTELANRIQHSSQTLTRPEQFYIIEHDPGEDYIEAYIPYVWKDADYPLALLLDHRQITIQPNETFTLRGRVFPENIQNQKVLWSTDQDSVNLTDHGDGSVTIQVAEQGKAVIKGYTEDSRVSKVCNVRCVIPNLKTNLRQLRPVSGDWCEEFDGMRGQGGGDIFMVSSEQINNFVYETDVVIEEGAAAALLFRVQSNASGFYCAFIDAYEKCVKLWRTETAIKVVPADIDRNRTYHLKVEMRDDHIKVYLNGTLMIDLNDSTYSDGCLGLNVFAGRGVFQHLYYQPL